MEYRRLISLPSLLRGTAQPSTPALRTLHTVYQDRVQTLRKAGNLKREEREELKGSAQALSAINRQLANK